MADIRIKDLATTATVTASDDFMAVDGTTNGTRKLSAATPSFLTSVTTPSLTSPASTNLTLAGGSGNTSVILTPAGTGNVGIGTTSPATLLTVYSAVAGTNKQMSLFDFAAGGATGSGYITVQASGNSTDFEQNTGGGGFRYSSTYFDTNIVNNATSSSAFGNINFITGNTSNSSIVMTIGGGSQKGVVSIYNTTAASANTGALVIAGGISAGNTGSAASYFGGTVTANGAGSTNYGAANPTLILNRASSAAGNFVRFQGTAAYDTYIGTIGTAAGIAPTADTFVIGSTVAGLPTFALVPSTGAATFAGAVSVGTGAAVGGATAGAGGLAFPATDVAVANANTLDDYEEGTWTPTLSPAGSPATGTITVASPNLCGYTKIGRVVTVNGLIEASAVSSPVGATVTIGGLPFPSNGNTNERSVGTVRAFSLTSGALNSTATIASSTQTASLFIDASLFQATSQFYIQLTYTV